MRGLAEKTVTLALYAYRLLEELHPMTLRQLHYAIFSKSEIDYQNDKASYRRLSEVTSMSRRLNRGIELELSSYQDCLRVLKLKHKTIPHDWIVDETREGEMVNVFTDGAEYADVVKVGYRRDYWQTQPNHCEVWSEKGTVKGSIRPVADELGITVRVCHGFGSTGMEGQVGNIFEGIRKDITVFYVGDHDPSGHVIERDIHRRAEIASGKSFDMIRLAIHAEDIRLFNLPPQRIKESDSRSRGFKDRFGEHAETVELDALPVDELRRRITGNVSALIDFDLWNQQKATEEIEFACITSFAETLKSLPQLQRPEA
jgi:hypothetical protein